MAFAPRGSRPKTTSRAGNASEERTDKQLDENARVPTLLGFNSPVETTRARERVSRKPPIPHGLTKTAPSRSKPVSTVNGSNTSRGNVSTSTARIKPSGRTVASHARTRITVETKKPLKPKLPSRLATGKAQSQVAPDSLSISAQLVPWIFMRSSLDAQLRSLEGQFERNLQAESDRLDRLEKDREDQKQKMELGAQIDMLEDLSRPENQSFTSQLIQVLNDARNLFSDTDSPQSLTVSAGKLALLQDRVHSDDWDPQIFEEISAQLDEMTKQATALQSSLLALSSKLDESLVLKASSHWENILRELAWLLQTRIASLEELSNAIPLVEAYQQARIELEVLKIGFP